MGLEDYRVLLKLKPRKSVFPEDGAGGAENQAERGGSRLAAEQVAAELERLGFVRQQPQLQSGPAKLAGPSRNEIRLSARHTLSHGGGDEDSDAAYVVEALVRGRDRSAGGAPLFESLSVRFAVCQPEGAAWHFLRLVKRLCEALSLEVVQGEKTYSSEAFWAFRLRANEQIRNQQVLWRDLFEGDGECEPIGVEESWGHFLKRHPGLLASSEATMAPRKATAAPEASDAEATVAPRVASPSPVRRSGRS